MNIQIDGIDGIDGIDELSIFYKTNNVQGTLI